MSYIDELQKRYESEGKGFVRITNKDLVCKDCMYRHDDSVIFGNTSRCDFYPAHKPNSILNGKDCTYYFKGEKKTMCTLRLYHTMSLESPNKANITIIDDKIYATDEDGKGLYSLVPPQMARYKGEGTLIDENFKLRKGLRKETIKRKIAERVSQLS